MKDLKNVFNQKVDQINSYQDPIPPDTLLRLYAL